MRVDEGDDEDYLTVHPRDDRRTVADALRLHPGLPKAELARVRPVPVCPSRPGRCPTRDDETLALRAPALALGARLPVGGPEGLWLLARLARRDVVLRSEPGDQPVEPALRPVLTSGMLAEVLRHYGAAGLAASDGGRLLSPGVGPLLDDGTYWLVREERSRRTLQAKARHGRGPLRSAAEQQQKSQSPAMAALLAPHRAR